jgi:hypothetical protein
MDAFVNLVLATSVSAVIVHSWLPPAIDESESTSNREPIAATATCTTVIKCHGDFPVPSNRKYAEVPEAHHWS